MNMTRFLRWTVVVGALLALVVLPLAARADERIEQKFEKIESLEKDGKVILSNISGTIEVRGWCENGTAPRRVKCAVTNTGSSIPAEDLPRVFDRFFRGDRARRTAAGSGLGLAITKQLVELNAGTVEAANSAEGGVTFTISLPG